MSSNVLASQPSKINWAPLIAAIVAISSVGIALGLGLPLLSIVLENRGISTSLIGSNTAMAGAASIILALFTTKLGSYFGVTRLMMGATVASALSLVLFYYTDNFWLWFPLRLVFSGSVTVLFILSEYWINMAAPTAHRGLIFGIYTTVLSFGFAAGPFILSIVGSEGVLPFYIGAFIILLSLIPLIAARKQSPELKRGKNHSVIKFVFLLPAATGAAFIFGAAESSGLALFPIYTLNNGFSTADSTLLLVALGLGNGFFQVPIGLLADRMKNRRFLLLLITIIGLAATILIPIILHSWNAIFCLMFVWGGINTGLYTVGLIHLGSRLTGNDLAAANAAFILAYSVGAFIGPQVVGFAMEADIKYGFSIAISVFFAFYLAITLVRIGMLRKQA